MIPAAIGRRVLPLLLNQGLIILAGTRVMEEESYIVAYGVGPKKSLDEVICCIACSAGLATGGSYRAYRDKRIARDIGQNVSIKTASDPIN